MSATDMSRHWRLVYAEQANETHCVYGVWWARKERVKTVDVTIWDNAMQCGWVFYSDGLTAFIEDGTVTIPKHMIHASEAHKAVAEDAWELLLAVAQSVADLPLPEVES